MSMKAGQTGKIDLLVASWELWPYKGGIGRYLHLLAEGLADIGLRVALLSPFAADGQGPGLRLRWRLPARRWWAPAALADLARALSCLRPRVTLLGDDLGTAAFSLAGAVMPWAVAVTRAAVLLHGTEVMLWGLRGPRWWARRRLMSRALGRACLICTNSRYTASLAQSLIRPKAPLCVLGGCVKAASPLPCPSPDGPLLTVCRLIPEKGVDTVMEALAFLRTQGIGLRYRVVGDGPDRLRLQELAHRLGLSGQVEFWGMVDDDELERAYGDASAFILMSRPGDKRVEGLGLVLLEAQAKGIPVIGSRAMGVPEAVGDAAILVDDYRDAQQVASAIMRVIADRQLREELRRRGLERARELTPAAMATRLVACLIERGCLG